MIILGIDPGFAIVGFAILEANHGKQRLIQCGAITTQAGLPLPARLLQIEQDMDELIAVFHPEAMAVEELFFNNNVTTGIGVAQARGVILPGQAGCGRLWQGGKTSGHGYDQTDIESQDSTKAGRCRRRCGDRPLSRPLARLSACLPRPSHTRQRTL